MSLADFWLVVEHKHSSVALPQAVARRVRISPSNLRCPRSSLMTVEARFSLTRRGYELAIVPAPPSSLTERLALFANGMLRAQALPGLGIRPLAAAVGSVRSVL